MSETTALSLWDDQNKLSEIKQIFAPNLSPTEFKTLVGIGQSTGLNPFLKEIWAVKYGNSAASIFIGRDGYRKSAQASRDYDWHFVDSIYERDSFKVVNGQPQHEYASGDRGALIGAYGLCKRKNSTQPNFVRVSVKEYNTMQSLWKTKPETMIKKVAEAQVLRMTFQDLFGGTYDESEEVEDREANTVSQDVSAKLARPTEASQDPVDALVEDAEDIVEMIDAEMIEIIKDLFVRLGYTQEQVPERIQALEERMKKPIHQFTAEEAARIAHNMEEQAKKIKEQTGAIKKETETEVEAEIQEEVKSEEPKKSAVQGMGEKARAEQEKIKNDPDFIKAFGDSEKLPDPVVEEQVADEGVDADEATAMFDDPQKPIDQMTEEELKNALLDAKSEFSAALKAWKANPNDETNKRRSDASAVCAEINQMIAKKGYPMT